MKKLVANFRLWLDNRNGQSVLGDGKWQLLKAIEKKGSLAAACRHLKISYRKAWGDLEKIQIALDVPLLEQHRGGSKGGVTILTAKGKELLEAYENFHRDIEKAAQKAYAKHIKKL